MLVWSRFVLCFASCNVPTMTVVAERFKHRNVQLCTLCNYYAKVAPSPYVLPLNTSW